MPETMSVSDAIQKFLDGKIDPGSPDGREFVNYAVQLLDAILNNPFEKVIITDRDGNITFINEAYCNVLSYSPGEVIGKNALRVLGKETRMHIVGRTLKPELHALFRVANAEAVARRVPLISRNKVLGVLGKDLFSNLYDLAEIARQAERLNRFCASVDLRERDCGNRAKYRLDHIISRDKTVIAIKEDIKRVARTSSTVLLQGETGVGKELFAHAIHLESHRADGPFVRVNCGAIPETLLESELFGYEEGAFTGARRGGKPGKFEIADGGTIFLDEIGEIPLTAQVKILRVLQEKEIERVGGTRTIPVDVRVVASTNRDLRQMCEEGAFRPDLFYRLSVVSISIPPLRDRPGDIPLLARHFIDKYNRAFGLQVRGIEAKEMKRLQSYHWPGNVRELEAVIEGAMNRADKSTKELTGLPALLGRKDQEAFADNLTLKDRLELYEAKIIAAALDRYHWDMEKTAASLGISQASLYRKISKYKLK